MNFQMFTLDLEKAEEAKIKFPTSKDHQKSKSSRKYLFCFIEYAKAFDCVDHSKLWKILKEMEYQTTWPASWETYVQVREQQQTGSK